MNKKEQEKMQQAYKKIFHSDWFNPEIFSNSDYVHEIQTWHQIRRNYSALAECLKEVGKEMYASVHKNRNGFFGSFDEVLAEPIKTVRVITDDTIVPTPKTLEDFDKIEQVDLGSLYSMQGDFGILGTLNSVYIISSKKEIMEKYYAANPKYLENRILALNYLNLEDDEINPEQFLSFMNRYFPQHIKDLDPEYYCTIDENEQ